MQATSTALDQQQQRFIKISHRLPEDYVMFLVHELYFLGF